MKHIFDQASDGGDAEVRLFEHRGELRLFVESEDGTRSATVRLNPDGVIRLSHGLAATLAHVSSAATELRLGGTE